MVWRVVRSAPEVLVIHRPRYNDWSFPKGKTEPDDVDEEHTALREVREETGYWGTLGREIATTSYLDNRRRAKQVRYWEMAVVGGEFTPNREVDEARWLPVPDARELLTYPHDREVLDAFGAFAGVDAPGLTR